MHLYNMVVYHILTKDMFT